ncbi:MAG TPA: DUF4908 domain-containing protein [Rhizomicrobium sp.]
MRSLLRIVLASVALCSAVPSTQAGLLQRIFGERIAPVEDGNYIAGDKIKFVLRRSDKNYLLRFDGDPETYVLHADHTSLGGRMLKYDSGETALKVAGWGGLTLYTDFAPNGSPAVRIGDAAPFAPSPVTLKDVQFLAAQDAQRLAHERHLRLPFVVNWSVLETDGALRATASEAIENTARGIERFVRDRQMRQMLMSRVHRVTFATGTRPMLGLQNKALIVTFNPERGYLGCHSSRAVARQLGTLLSGTREAAAQ